MTTFQLTIKVLTDNVRDDMQAYVVADSVSEAERKALAHFATLFPSIEKEATEGQSAVTITPEFEVLSIRADGVIIIS